MGSKTYQGSVSGVLIETDAGDDQKCQWGRTGVWAKKTQLKLSHCGSV
jgi:hypothetical protein